MNIITVHRQYDDAPIRVNIKSIAMYQSTTHGEGSYISLFGNNSSVKVSETVEEIDDMLAYFDTTVAYK